MHTTQDISINMSTAPQPAATKMRNSGFPSNSNPGGDVNVSSGSVVLNSVSRLVVVPKGVSLVEVTGIAVVAVVTVVSLCANASDSSSSSNNDIYSSTYEFI